MSNTTHAKGEQSTRGTSEQTDLLQPRMSVSRERRRGKRGERGGQGWVQGGGGGRKRRVGVGSERWWGEREEGSGG